LTLFGGNRGYCRHFRGCWCTTGTGIVCVHGHIF